MDWATWAGEVDHRLGQEGLAGWEDFSPSFFLFKKPFSVLFFWLVLKSFKNSFGTTKLLEKYGFTFGMKRR
jgi:hypothetical protein